MSGFAAAAVAAGAIAALPAPAQDFPNRAVRMIVPYGPGGITDITARIIGPGMAEDLGQQVVVENRPGGAAIPGLDLVAKSRPDGYTIVAATTALAAQPILFRKLPYQADRDFAPISLVVLAPTVLVVHPSIPARTVKEFIALAKSRPGAGGGGEQNGATFVCEFFRRGKRLPIKQDGPSVQAFPGTQVG
jgi:tripartite-type tricarboxylate transporter receptor subunit TctC